MRIIAGTLKNSTLYLPKNKNTRPLKDMVRESIFNFLMHSNKIPFQLEKSIVLDLFAGTGSFGLECISRKAEKVYFVENDKYAIQFLKKNIDKLQVQKKTKILNKNVFDILKKKNVFESKLNLIFCDPPFKKSNIEKIVESIFINDLLKKNGIIILHRNKITKEKLPNYLKIIDERTYGISKIIFAQILV